MKNSFAKRLIALSAAAALAAALCACGTKDSDQPAKGTEEAEQYVEPSENTEATESTSETEISDDEAAGDVEGTDIDVAGDTGSADEEEVSADASAFEGVWGCGRASMSIWPDDEEGSWQVIISWASSASEETTWTYTCSYDAASGCLAADGNGIRVDAVYADEGGDPDETVVYTTGSATFSLKNGSVTWADSVDNAGEDMEFVK